MDGAPGSGLAEVCLELGGDCWGAFEGADAAGGVAEIARGEMKPTEIGMVIGSDMGR
jgi:hypothetical protein